MGIDIWICTKRWKSKPRTKMVSYGNEFYLNFDFLMFEIDYYYMSGKGINPYIKFVFGINKTSTEHMRKL